MKPARQAFTLIEMLVVMGIILILIGLVILGANYTGKAAKAGSTQVAMETLRKFQAEWETVMNALAVSNNELAYLTDSLAKRQPLDVPPGDMSNLTLRDNPATRFTRGVIGRLMGITKNRVIIAKLPANRIWSWPISSSVARWSSSSTYNYYDQVWENVRDPINTTADLVTASGNNLKRYFICQWVHTASDPKTQPVVGASSALYWLPVSSDTPVLVDGWGNPIIFVPPTGLTAPAFNTNGVSHVVGSRVQMSGSPGQEYRCIRAFVAVDNSFNPNTMSNPERYWVVVPSITSPDGRPFWASAGPDGNFQNADDNIYSFEK
jgi:prepilin-type N-terminal cleavage/methylation domain-containing protein